MSGSMTDDSGEQQELSESSPDTQRQTLQQRIIELYNSSNLFHVAIGYWSKLIVEAIIVTVPLVFIIVLPGVLLAWAEIGPITYLRVVGAWVTVSVTILGFSWCLTESALPADDRNEGNDEDADQD